MAKITIQQLAAQLRHLTDSGLRLLLDKHATAHGLNRSFVYAICSRETNCVNELGDFQGGEYHGVGVMQIDIQHALAQHMRDLGTWETNPEPLIQFGCTLLATNWGRVRDELPGLLGLLPEVQLKVAASGYNCGITRAIGSVLNGDDSDAHTTGHDYGADVIARMKIFDQLVTA